jgi:hypothetical protein
MYSPLSSHHPLGRYEERPATEEHHVNPAHGGPILPIEVADFDFHSTHDMSDSASENSVVVRSDLRPIESPFRRHSFTQTLANLGGTHLEKSPSLTSIASIDMTDILLPVNDPLLDKPPSSSGSSTGSWESATDSDPDTLELENSGDGVDDAFLDLDSRFIDSGWGGECLREIEDIDFEFVYALHTFVATVEGQANATKGDTMVLLDDSNSYWWLVRVVKDSSIGMCCAERSAAICF